NLRKKHNGVSHMIKKTSYSIMVTLIALIFLLSACGQSSTNNDATDKNDDAQTSQASEDTNQVTGPHEGLNQEPVPIKIDREGKDVYVEMTTQITDIEIAPNNIYKAWTFNGEAPGPLIVIEEGDTLHISLDNMDPVIPHSIDLHAVHTNPAEGFADVAPNEDGTFSFPASSPGVFMYHCATEPVLSHIANGMHGV